MHGYVLLNAPLARGRCSICSAAWGNRYILVFDDVTCLMYTCIYMYMYICTECVQDCKYRYVYVCVPVSAQGFQYDDLYVTAHLQLPECKFHPTSEPTPSYTLHLVKSYSSVYLHVSLGGMWDSRTVSCYTNLQDQVKTLGKNTLSCFFVSCMSLPSLMCSLAEMV